MSVGPYHYPTVCYIKNDDPEVPVFNYDEVINPMPAYKNEELASSEDLFAENAVTDEELEEFELPEGVEPLISEQPLYTENT